MISLAEAEHHLTRKYAFYRQFTNDQLGQRLIDSKFRHTQGVVNQYFQITEIDRSHYQQLNPNQAEQDLVGVLLHDLHRASQMALTGSFSDTTFDHAIEAQFDILQTYRSRDVAQVIADAVAQHNKSEADKDIQTNGIIRDSDKLQIIAEMNYHLLSPDYMGVSLTDTWAPSDAFIDAALNGNQIVYGQNPPQNPADKILSRVVWFNDLNFKASQHHFVEQSMDKMLIKLLRRHTPPILEPVISQIEETLNYQIESADLNI